MARKLVIEPGEYVVCRVPGQMKAPQARDGLSVSLTFGDETTIICPFGDEPMLADIERGWRWVRLDASMGFEEVGVMASFLEPVKSAGISVMALSSFATDHVLVKNSQLRPAVDAWRSAGFTVSGS